MTLSLALLIAAAQPAAAPPPPPPGLQFGFYRIAAIQHRARELRCGTGDLNIRFDALRKRLAARYGKKAFAIPKLPATGPGDCGVVLSVYRVNLDTFSREAEAALAADPQSSAARKE